MSKVSNWDVSNGGRDHLSHLFCSDRGRFFYRDHLVDLSPSLFLDPSRARDRARRANFAHPSYQPFCHGRLSPDVSPRADAEVTLSRGDEEVIWKPDVHCDVEGTPSHVGVVEETLNHVDEGAIRSFVYGVEGTQNRVGGVEAIRSHVGDAEEILSLVCGEEAKLSRACEVVNAPARSDAEAKGRH